MAIEAVTSGRMRRGKLQVSLTPTFSRQLKTFKDGPVLVRIERTRASRSQQQNRYWWGVCIHLVSEHTGYSPEEIHELAKQMFLPKTLAVANGNGEIVGEYVLGGSSTKLDVVEFGAFIERFKQWAAETLDVVIPDPDGHP